MFCNNPEYCHYSTDATYLVVPRPTLSGVTLDTIGIPCSIGSNKYFTTYPDILGIQVKDYLARKRQQRIDYVAYKLADGNYLVAPWQVIEASKQAKTYTSQSECYITPVNQMVALDALPKGLYDDLVFYTTKL
ncbi:MAG: hypothetical protein RM049_18430 [Nostoc sp. DedQUE04]|uniref:hypothetical protein n=1 Tax=Nostoc sp. DedQUE04 TaxID=3075390 RepID=UPI002AD55E77|nr:hypothetical protein [Nostoc sp. DedQUE04]MDZ8137252.1 hypothetical protein [Nostoc sp. DedQUE04]